jgi:hypothetical protein
MLTGEQESATINTDQTKVSKIAAFRKIVTYKENKHVQAVVPLACVNRDGTAFSAGRMR